MTYATASCEAWTKGGGKPSLPPPFRGPSAPSSAMFSTAGRPGTWGAPPCQAAHPRSTRPERPRRVTRWLPMGMLPWDRTARCGRQHRGHSAARRCGGAERGSGGRAKNAALCQRARPDWIPASRPTSLYWCRWQPPRVDAALCPSGARTARRSGGTAHRGQTHDAAGRADP